jgi:hypothetical protein
MFNLQKDHISSDANLTLDLKLIRQDELCRSFEWIIVNSGDADFEGTVRLKADIPAKLRNPWVLVPGFIYGENRRLDQAIGLGKKYPRFDFQQKIPEAMSSSWWDFAADRTASPLVFMHSGDSAFAVAAYPHYSVSSPEIVADDPEPQVGVGFAHDGEAGYIRFSIPACEEPFTYSNQVEGDAPTINRIKLGAGQSISGKLFVYQLKGVQHCYHEVLEHYYSQMAETFTPAEFPDIKSLSEDAIYGIIDGHYQEADNYFAYSRSYDPVPEQIANLRAGITLEWHQMMTGFVNGIPVCNALLKGSQITGDKHAREVALKVVEKFCKEGISPSGLFWADWMPEVIRTPNGELVNPFFKDREPWGSGWLPQATYVHSRTIADACWQLAEMILMEKETAPESEHVKLWEKALLSNLNVALDLQLPGGSYGQYYDAVERKVTKEDGCGGLLWIPAMLRAVKLGLGGDEMVQKMTDSVKKAALAYAEYVEAEYIWGAPEDNDSPTSEDGLNAVMAYCELYEYFNDPKYLELGRLAADWMLTFRKTYNQKLPENCLMGKYGMKSMGGDFASSSNNHLHVFEILCTRHLCALADWTGKEYYRQRAYEHCTFVFQYLSRCDGMYNGFRGAMAEQFYWTNWGSWGDWRGPDYHHQKGNMASFTAVWCIAVLLLGAYAADKEFGNLQN